MGVLLLLDPVRLRMIVGENGHYAWALILTVLVIHGAQVCWCGLNSTQQRIRNPD